MRDTSCIICGRKATDTHHLIFGNGLRSKADEDNLTIEMCSECHNRAIKAYSRIHGNPMAEHLSKMLGQALWERDYIKAHPTGNAREAFMERYGINYL